ncbi:hypothetical protein CI610_02660 [invertebrate metagenome]|uniref:Reverse transcriptase domain-containing protein n=1 Tax=invertebrate metagenome TaxID=1711999 RepID=A0A2H9T5C3_9ZZZZ
MKRKCRKYLATLAKNTNDDTSNARHLKCVQEYSGAESGLFVHLDINGVQAKFLIDTGATVSLVSKQIFRDIDSKQKVKLQPMTRDILGANDLPMATVGKGRFQITIDSYSCECMAVVVDMKLDGIIGLDFLKESRSVIDCAQGKMRIGQKDSTLTWQGTLGCYRVSMKETLSIAPRSEVICEGIVQVPDSEQLPDDTFIMESSERFMKKGQALVARTIVNAGETVPLRLLNPSDQTVKVYRHTHVGRISPVDKVLDNDESEIGQKYQELPDHLVQLYEEAKEELTPEQAKQVRQLLLRTQDLFAKSDDDLGRTDMVKHKIDTQNAKPIKQPPRRFPHHAAEEVDQQVQSMLDRGIIEPSSSPWASGVVLVQKKDGSLRFCVDYRALNKVTVKDAYPLPRIGESLDRLSGAKWFSTLDLFSGYWQVEMDETDKQKTAFVTRSGFYHFNVMPFGLCNSPATFERLMETVLAQIGRYAWCTLMTSLS